MNPVPEMFCFICFEKKELSIKTFKCIQCTKEVCHYCFDLIKKKTNVCPYCRFEFENDNKTYNTENIIGILDNILEFETPRIFRRQQRRRIYSDLTNDRVPINVRERRNNKKIRQKERKIKRRIKMLLLFPHQDDIFI